jgi:hypothetical protein
MSRLPRIGVNLTPGRSGYTEIFIPNGPWGAMAPRSPADVGVRDRGELAYQRRGEQDEPERDLRGAEMAVDVV